MRLWYAGEREGVPMAEREAWDRQGGETSAAFAAFRRYRDLGPARSIRDAVIAWLTETPPRHHQQRRYRQLVAVRLVASGERVPGYVESVRRRWKEWSRSWGWRRRVRLFDERVEQDARQRVITDHVDAEAEQMRLRIVAARRLRGDGLAVWERFQALIATGDLEELTLARRKHVITTEPEAAVEAQAAVGAIEAQEAQEATEGRPAVTAVEAQAAVPAIEARPAQPGRRVEVEVVSIATLLREAREAIATGLREERLETGEATDRTAVDVSATQDIDAELEAMGREG